MMARLCRRGHGLIAFALIAASVFPCAVLASTGDINNDQRVDVLDLQCLSASLLAERVASSVGDVNHDGRIDVLDFQCAVNMATGQARDGADQPTRPEAPPAPARAASTDLLAIKTASRAVIVPPTHEGAARHELAPALGTTGGSALHRLGLTPNAPPTC